MVVWLLPATKWAQQRQHLVDADDQHLPEIVRRALGLHLRRLHHCALCQRHNLSPVRRVWCQHTKVAVAMRARGWHQGCNALDQLQWRECDFIDLCAPLVVRFADRLVMLFGTAVHQPNVRFAQPIQRKRWPCTLAQQALQADAVMRCYAHAGVD
jgi:hypothetical protein